MTANSTLMRQVVLRHHADGYLRFDLPPGLCAGAPAAIVTEHLQAVEGIYRVSLYPDYDKLAVRFHAAVCDLHRVAVALAAGLARVEAEGLAPGCEACARRAREEAEPTGLKARIMNLGPVRWAREKAEQVRQSTAALRQLSQARFKRVPAVLENPEKAIHEFLTDILVLYLIKVHWHRITTQWLRAPWQFRYEWMAVFYLIYLMMRARRKGS